MKKSIALVLAAAALSTAPAADLEFVRDLIAIPSVSEDVPQVNRAVRLMKGYLESRGVYCAVETTPQGREVLYASVTPGKGHEFVLAPHLDVVPAADPSQFEMKRDGDRITGRGSNDCKGRAASVAEVLVSLAGSGLSVGCLFGSDEEIGGEASRWMVEQKGYGPTKMAIVADTGGNKLVYAHKGHAIFMVRARGRSGHSSAPWACDDSITKVARGYMRVREEWDRRHPLADDRWCDVLTPTMVNADAGAKNIIPGAVDMALNLRSVREEAEAEALELLRREMEGCEVELERSSPPVSSDPGHPLMQRLRKTMGETLGMDVPMERMFAATDARCFVRCGVPIAMVGAVGGGAHAADEWESVSSLDAMRDYLARFLRQEASRQVSGTAR